MKTTTLPNPETQARIQQVKLGVDWHADHFRVARMCDGQSPQPAQQFTPFLTFVQKQLTLADQVLVVYEAGPDGHNRHPALFSFNHQPRKENIYGAVSLSRKPRQKATHSSASPPSMRFGPAYHDARQLQGFLSEIIYTETTPAADVAQCARAWIELEKLKPEIRGIPPLAPAKLNELSIHMKRARPPVLDVIKLKLKEIGNARVTCVRLILLNCLRGAELEDPVESLSITKGQGCGAGRAGIGPAGGGTCGEDFPGRRGKPS